MERSKIFWLWLFVTEKVIVCIKNKIKVKGLDRYIINKIEEDCKSKSLWEERV